MICFGLSETRVTVSWKGRVGLSKLASCCWLEVQLLSIYSPSDYIPYPFISCSVCFEKKRKRLLCF